MKPPVISAHQVTTSSVSTAESAAKEIPLTPANSPANHAIQLTEQTPHGLPFQQGRARAAGLRQALEQNAPAAERKLAAGTVIKYPADQKNARRQRAEPGEDLMPLDEEIHHLNGSRRNVQQDRKQVLAQRRQANRGFKNVMLEHTEPAEDLVSEGWGEDH